jgi:hypothetical protein
MRSLPSLAASFAVACVLLACSSSSSPPPVDASVSETSTEDASEDTGMTVIPDAAEAGPPMCKDGCPKTAPTCCENGLSPNLGLCYDSTKNPMFCANEGGA